MRVTNNTEFRYQIDSMYRQYDRIYHLEKEVGASKKVLRGSDDPVASQRAQSVEDYIASMKSYEFNINLSSYKTNFMDTLVQDSIQTLSKVNVLILQAQSDTTSANDKKSIAVSINSLLTHLLTLANARDNNNDYIFSGMNVKTQPFALGQSGYNYQGSQNPTQVPISDEILVVNNEDGSHVFGQLWNGSQLVSIFDVLSQTVNALNNSANLAPSDFHAQMASGQTLLNQSVENISEYLSNLGSRGDVILEQKKIYEQQVLDQRSLLLDFSDADLSEVISELTLRLTTVEIMQKSYAKIQETLRHIYQ